MDSCPLLRSYFIGSCHVGVSKRFSRSISLAVFCLYTHFILADQISCRSYTLVVFILCGPFSAVSNSSDANSVREMIDQRFDFFSRVGRAPVCLLEVVWSVSEQKGVCFPAQCFIEMRFWRCSNSSQEFAGSFSLFRYNSLNMFLTLCLLTREGKFLSFLIMWLLSS